VGRDLPGLCSHKYPLSSQDSNQLSVKIEKVSDVKEEEVPVPITWQATKPEHEVSCVSDWPLLSRRYTYAQYCVVFLPSPVSVCVSDWPLLSRRYTYAQYCVVFLPSRISVCVSLKQILQGVFSKSHVHTVPRCCAGCIDRRG
jgi:hypothetical protein